MEQQLNRNYIRVLIKTFIKSIILFYFILFKNISEKVKSNIVPLVSFPNGVSRSKAPIGDLRLSLFLKKVNKLRTAICVAKYQSENKLSELLRGSVIINVISSCVSFF